MDVDERKALSNGRSTAYITQSPRAKGREGERPESASTEQLHGGSSSVSYSMKSHPTSEGRVVASRVRMDLLRNLCVSIVRGLTKWFTSYEEVPLIEQIL